MRSLEDDFSLTRFTSSHHQKVRCDDHHHHRQLRHNNLIRDTSGNQKDGNEECEEDKRSEHSEHSVHSIRSDSCVADFPRSLRFEAFLKQLIAVTSSTSQSDGHHTSLRSSISIKDPNKVLEDEDDDFLRLDHHHKRQVKEEDKNNGNDNDYLSEDAHALDTGIGTISESTPESTELETTTSSHRREERMIPIPDSCEMIRNPNPRTSDQKMRRKEGKKKSTFLSGFCCSMR